MRCRRLTTLILGCLLVVAGVAAPSASAQAAQVTRPEEPTQTSTVCVDIARCHVVARVDVNGDGARDTVGLARRGNDGALHGAVIVRVQTSARKVVAVRRKTIGWSGKVWQGAASLDGRPGKELVLGWTAGAHALFFTALTWRHGELVNLRAPGDSHWGIDGSVSSVVGWLKRPGEPAGVIRSRVAERKLNPSTSRFEGTVTTFKWSRNGWTKIDAKQIDPLRTKRAWTWAGFHVRGLARF